MLTLGAFLTLSLVSARWKRWVDQSTSRKEIGEISTRRPPRKNDPLACTTKYRATQRSSSRRTSITLPISPSVALTVYRSRSFKLLNMTASWYVRVLWPPRCKVDPHSAGATPKPVRGRSRIAGEPGGVYLRRPHCRGGSAVAPDGRCSGTSTPALPVGKG